eukprot:jgi/Undpi1/11713/HiC_scaffold_37.g14008.m1
MTRFPPRRPQASRDQEEGGFALIMVLVFTFLLYLLITDLVTGARVVRIAGENDALAARMRNLMSYSLAKVEQTLLDDLAAASGGGEEGALPGAGPGSLPGGGGEGPLGGGEGEGEGEEEDPAAAVDSSRDTWFEPQAWADGDITVYSWAEDENRKFNLLTLLAEDEEFARLSRTRLVRLIDALREDTEFDVSNGDAEAIADEFMQFTRAGGRTEQIPLAPLKSDRLDAPVEITVPLHTDELLMLKTVDTELFYDKVFDGRVIPGLESVVTVYTSMGLDPGSDESNARLQERREQSGEGGDPAAAATGEGEGEGPGAPGEEPEISAEGLGTRININTAPRAVLRCLFDRSELPDLVIDAILRYRNELDEDAAEAASEDSTTEDYSGDVDLGVTEPKQIFTAVEDLEQVQEWANLGDPTIKDRFYELCGVRSDVFTVHMAAVYKRSDAKRIYVMRRTASVMMRLENAESGYLHPIVLLEERRGLRIKGQDFPDEAGDDLLYGIYSEMDTFAQEERAWNPFLPEFYLPDDKRQNFYDPEYR